MDTRNIIALQYSESLSSPFRAVNPYNGIELEGDFFSANPGQVDAAVKSADDAFKIYRNINKDAKAAFIRAIANEIAALGEVLIQRAAEESGLPAARLQGERGRTIAQLNMFADQVEEGSWVEAIIDSAMPDRQPAARPDLRRMLVPVGPVVVFGASNFPLAFSVAGGDTASALAAGCPVIVKAHSAHPGTSALVAAAIVNAAKITGMPEGVFSLLYDGNSNLTGQLLVKHPLVKAVAFTGSFRGGMALSKLASERNIPIPVFAEMGSINPVILLPEALDERAEQVANECVSSITLGAGQFCTNPGLLVAVKSPSLENFKAALIKAVERSVSSTMLNSGIFENYCSLSENVLSLQRARVLSRSENINRDGRNQAVAAIAEISASDFLSNPEFKEEIFGPWSLLVVAEDIQQMQEVLEIAGGQLTVSIMTGANGAGKYTSLLNQASEIAGRVLMNGMPTGVEVCHAMQHGGPFPATTDSRFTSVGTTAIKRFARPVCWQNWEPGLLPDELKNENPLNIWRLADKQWTKD